MPSILLSDNGVSSGSAGLKTTASNDGILVLQTTTAGGAATTAVTIGTNQAVTFAQAASLPNTFGFKNRIINGGMVIDQRNAGASVAFSSGSAFAADRFSAYNQTTGAYTIQRVTDAPAGFSYSDRVTTTTAGSTGTASWTSFVQQKIEGFNIADLGAGTSSAQTITLSFWVKSSLTGAMPVVFGNDADRTYATTYTINAANTWEQKTITLALPTGGTWNSTNGRGLLITWGLGSGSTFTTSTLNSWQNLDGLYFTSGAVAVGGTLNATWQITGVQLEKGSTATSFDYRPYGTELALCQRYYCKFSGSGYSAFGLASSYSTTLIGLPVKFPVTMRTTPSGLDSSAANTFLLERDSASALTPTALTIANASAEQGKVNFTVSGASTGGAAYQTFSNGTLAFMAFGAEL